MKNIINFDATKYEHAEYLRVEEWIYRIEDKFVTSLAFEQEPELGEGESPKNISQYPLEDILDEFYVHISDFYDNLNNNSNTTCYYEFASDDIEDVRKLRSIIGKHVYNKTKTINGDEYEELIIE